MKNRQYEFDHAAKEENEEEATKQETNEVGIDNATYTKESHKESTKDMLAGLKESDVDFEEVDDDINDDVQFEEVDSFEDVGKLGQFKRAYAQPTAFKKPLPAVELNAKKSTSTSSKIGGSIRRSIRKLIHPTKQTANNNNENDENEKHEGLFQTIRQSLRRKHKPKTETTTNALEATMIGRQVFRETINEEIPSRTLEKRTLKRNVIKTVKTFMESVEEFDHY
jgi:hypothetical protein